MTSVAVPPMDMLAQRPLGTELDTGARSLGTGKAVAFADQPAKVMATSDEMARVAALAETNFGVDEEPMNYKGTMTREAAPVS